MTSNLFAIPVHDQVLLYAPLHRFAALVNDAALRDLQTYFRTGKTSLPEIACLLSAESEPEPVPRQGELIPSALGLLPTRGCNLACQYCGFVTPEISKKPMPLELARAAVLWYMDQVEQHNLSQAEIHFFGGEPFNVEEVVDLAVTLGQQRAREIRCAIRFEVATNGTFSEARGHWIADHFSTVVLSFDGPEDIQNRNRPAKNNHGSFAAVYRNAKILSEGAADLFMRTCVTEDTVHRMPEIAAWFCAEFRPGAVSFEPLQPTAWSRAAGLREPDPWLFVENYIAAAQILEDHGVRAVYAPSEIDTRQVTFCPVGRDFVIVSPNGDLAACYQLEQDWIDAGLDFHLGVMDVQHGVQFDPRAVERIRRFNVHEKPLCQSCFCRWHCAGGCHLNHPVGATYDRLCIQARLITVHNILKAMGQEDRLQRWLSDPGTMRRSAEQPSDLLVEIA